LNASTKEEGKFARCSEIRTSLRGIERKSKEIHPAQHLIVGLDLDSLSLLTIFLASIDISESSDATMFSKTSVLVSKRTVYHSTLLQKGLAAYSLGS
jgi:hypothetical protein